MSFDAARTYQDVRKRYVDFLLERTLGAERTPSTDNFRSYLERYWSSERPGEGVFSSPVIEALFPYPGCGRTIDELCAGERPVFDSRMRRFIPRGTLGDADQLYAHQLRAVEESKTKNIIVASGTGSGKTECFLYSMINNLLQDPTEDLTRDGVRILMIYPMNALVKDQLQRIVKMVNGVNPRISVGMYTSQTPETETEVARQDWEQGVSDDYYRRSRDVIRARPPHILITNYSMLEYMMLRRNDNSIFGEGGSSLLKAIVLDEAHLYSGVKGNDITMLIRRTLDRFNKPLLDDNGHTVVRFYATSATIRHNEPGELTRAAASLFGIPEGEVAAINGTRDYYASRDIVNWNPEGDVKRRALDLVNRVIADGGMATITDEELEIVAEIPEDAVNESDKPVFPYKLHVFTQSANRCYSDMRLSDETPLGNLRQTPSFDGGVMGLDVYGVNRNDKEFYFKGAMTREVGDRFIFNEIQVEATDIAIDVYFRLRVPVADDGRVGFRLEPAMMTVDGREYHAWRAVPDAEGPLVFALKDFSIVNENNQFSRAADAGNDGEWFFADGTRLSEFVGVVSDDNPDDDSPAGSVATEDSYYRAGQSIVPLGFVPRSLRASTLTELLAPHLPEASGITDAERATLPWAGRQMLFFSDSRQNAAEIAVNLQKTHHEELIRNYIYQGLLSGYLQGGYESICRQIIGDLSMMAQFSLPQMAYMARGGNGPDIAELKGWLVRALVFQEIGIKRVGKRSLEGMGMIKATFPAQYTPPMRGGSGRTTSYDLGEVLIDSGLWETEVFPALVDIFRKRRCVFSFFAREWYTIDENEKKRDAQASVKVARRVIQNGLGYLYRDVMDSDERLLSPSSFRNARRGGDIDRFLNQYFRPDLADGSFTEAIRAIFQCLAANSTAWANMEIRTVFAKAPKNGGGNTRREPGYAFNVDALSYESVDRQADALRPVSDGFYFKRYAETETFEDDGFGGVSFCADALKLGGLRVPEHSAQVDKKVLLAIENSFKKKEINILSCTPTMEVGVDIGGLSTVVQGNLSPSKANYVQRAGRAGRRNEHSALTLTMTGSDVPDMRVMSDPMDIFNRTNYFAYANVSKDSARAQVIRHLNQFLINAYVRDQFLNQDVNNPMGAWDYCGNFLATRDVMESYAAGLRDIINNDTDCEDWERERCRVDLDRVSQMLQGGVFPRCSNLGPYLTHRFEDRGFKTRIDNILAGTVVTSAEVPDLIDDLARRLTEVSDSFSNLLQGLVNEFNDENAAGGHANVRRFMQHQFRNYYQEMLIRYLSQQYILPSYGFPIDVVDMQAGKHRIQRSVFTAVQEFTPGSNITIAHEKFSVDALAFNFADQNHTVFEKYKLVTCAQCGAIRKLSGADVNAYDCQCGQHISHTPGNIRGCSVEVYAQPRGFRSFADSGRDAASERKGRVYTNVKTFLEHRNPTVQRAALGVPVPARFREFPIGNSNEEDCVWVHCINRGQYHKGFLIDNQTGEIVSSRNPEADNRWRREGQGRNSVSGPLNLGYAARVSALLCEIPCDQIDIDNMPYLGRVLGAAFQTVAVRKLELDPREIQCEVKRLPGVLLVYLYDMSGTSGYMEELMTAHESILSESLEAIEECVNLERFERTLVNSVTMRGLRGITEYDIGHIVNWIGNNKRRLVSARYEVYSPEGAPEGGYHVESVGEFVDPVRAGHTEEMIVLLGWRPDLIETGAVTRFMTEKGVRRLHVVIDEFANHDCPDTVRAELCNRMRTEMDTLAALQPSLQLVYHVVDYRTHELGALYAQGFRLRVGDCWYIQMPVEALPDSTDSAIAEEVSRNVFEGASFRHWLRVTDSITTEALGAGNVEAVDLSTLAGARIAWTRVGERLSARPISSLLNDLGLNLQSLIVRSIAYDDPYFYTPAEWKTLEMILREFTYAPGARVKIRAAAPMDTFDRRVFRMPYTGVSEVRCGRFCNFDLTLQDARLFAGYVRQECRGLEAIDIDYTENALPHGRVMTIVGEENGITRTHKLIFDRGLDLLDFASLTASVPLMRRGAEAWAQYTRNLYVAHEVV